MSMYSRIVVHAKWLLVVLIVAMMGLLVALPFLNPMHKQLKLTQWLHNNDSDKVRVGDFPVMLNPRYQGFDKDENSFHVEADAAAQEDKDGRIILTRPSADMNLKQTRWVSLRAQQGFFEHEERILKLLGGVEFFSDDGYNFNTEHTIIDGKHGTAEGSMPLEGFGPLGTLESKKFKVEQNGEIIRFEGGVRVVVYVEKLKEAEEGYFDSDEENEE